MNCRMFLVIALASTALSVHAQTDLVFPWVTNSATFRGRLIINNLNTTAVGATLVATREPDAAEAVKTQTVQVTLDPFVQFVAEAATLFDQMGDGSAFTVRLTSDAGNLDGALVNVSTLSQSGSSPSQTNVLRADQAGPRWLFNYLYIQDGFSAPVIINLGNEDVTATLYAYQNGARVDMKEITVGAGAPWADVVGNVFPQLTGDLYLVVDAPGASLLATAFLFNAFEFLEPAMANATPLDAVPNPDGSSDTVSFSAMIQPIFTASCGDGGNGCHLNGGDEEGLRLDAGLAYAAIVGVRSNAVNSETRVVPGDPTASYLYRKLLPIGNGNFYAGDRMPDQDGDTPLLSEAETELIRTWILQGALDN